MNILRDDKEAAFMALSRGERVRLMMLHSWEIQQSPLRDIALKRDAENFIVTLKEAQQENELLSVLQDDAL